MTSKIFKLKNRGISIIEVIVALSVIILTMTGISSLVIQSLQVKNDNKYQLIASMLAQEGLELVRNKRDNNWLSLGANWDDNIALPNYAIDFDPTQGVDGVTAVSGIDDDDTRLYLRPDGYYTHASAGNAATVLRRLITVDTSESGRLQVTAKVQWRTNLGARNYEAVIQLFNWRGL